MKKLCILLSLLAIFLCSCRSTGYEEAEIFAMDTMMTIKVWGDNADSHISDITGIINESAARLSVTDESSEISRLNRGESVVVSKDTLRLLQTSITLSDRTGGAFDPTVSPLVDIWGFRENTSPDLSSMDGSLENALYHVGTEHIRIDKDTVTLDPGSGIDLGGIAKGDTAQRCADYLRENGTTAALLSFGGNIQTIGTKPDGSNWVIGIADPDSPAQAIAKLTFGGSLALVTSGSYQRYVEIDGTKYHHIINPKTGWPVKNGLTSVTVLAQNGTVADALSTALFVMGLEEAETFWRNSTDFEAIFITEDGQIFLTEGVQELISGCEYKVIER